MFTRRLQLFHSRRYKNENATHLLDLPFFFWHMVIYLVHASWFAMQPAMVRQCTLHAPLRQYIVELMLHVHMLHSRDYRLQMVVVTSLVHRSHLAFIACTIRTHMYQTFCVHSILKEKGCSHLKEQCLRGSYPQVNIIPNYMYSYIHVQCTCT